MFVNKLYLGDNLEILKSIKTESIDLIYLDPPFFSNKHYEVIWGDKNEMRSFEDRWSGGIMQYTGWLKDRVIEMYRVLKSTGSIFLHCDWHSNAYIRVNILDEIFGEKNFRNEIIWFYKTRPQSKKYFGRKHDTIFFYTKSAQYTFNWEAVARPLSESARIKYRLKDKQGRLYRLQGRGIKGSPVHSMKDIDPKWEITNPELVVRDYLDEKKGVALEDWWEIDTINQNSEELIGYPTQKPEFLLDRIIKACSNENDKVLDPFMGGGTTIVVADRLNRKWIGIDQSPMAVKVTDFRLQKQNELFPSAYSYTVQLYKYDYDDLRNKDPFEFETWIIQQYGGIPNKKQHSDSGIDGKTKDGTPIQVKRSDSIVRDVVDKFLSAIQRNCKDLFNKNKKDKKPIGHLIAFNFSSGLIEEVARLKAKEGIIINLVKVEDIIPISNKPTITVDVRELISDDKDKKQIEFTAKGKSESGIEFYSWDFNYDKEKGFIATIIMDKPDKDKPGKQTQTFNPGTYNIAVKAIDTDGLENIESFTLQVNGGIKKIK